MNVTSAATALPQNCLDGLRRLSLSPTTTSQKTHSYLGPYQNYTVKLVKEKIIDTQNDFCYLEHAFQEKKSKSQNLMQHFEFSRNFSALAIEQEWPTGQNGRAISIKKVRENSKCCIEF